MQTVWLLQHVHEWDDGREDIKLIGVFATEEEATLAVAGVKDKPGFRDLPEGFSVCEQRLGFVHWTEGYVTLSTQDKRQ